jgi:ribosomal-protein-alanine N-acetyltransferase
LVSDLIELASGSVIFLEVRTDNVPAIALYESFGFVNVGLRRRYYRASGADAYTMKRLPVEDPS